MDPETSVVLVFLIIAVVAIVLYVIYNSTTTSGTKNLGGDGKTDTPKSK